MEACLLVLDAFVASLRAAYDVLVYVLNSVYRTLCPTPFVSYADYLCGICRAPFILHVSS